MTDSLRDQFSRSIDYLRVSVTDRCDLRCQYCLPKGCNDFEPREEWLDFGEIERVVAAFARLGVKRIRLTGGEPLTRRGITELSGRLAQVAGIEDLSLSTNGTQLAGLAAPLKAAGVSRINVSLDTLDRHRFEALTGRDALPKVLAGIAAAHDAGIAPIKINMVILPDTSAADIDVMVAYCRDRGFVLRLIEAMPIGDSGRGAGFISIQPTITRLQEKFDLVAGIVKGGGPARYLVSGDGRFSVGFITAMSRHFCETCNRVRLTADGRLLLCLGEDASADLRTPLRQGISDDRLDAEIRHAIARKPYRHEFNEKPEKIVRFMSSTGG
ncbi:MAG: GTP 3',8-cyclase MoaA [Burkholderiales bacterium]